MKKIKIASIFLKKPFYLSVLVCCVIFIVTTSTTIIMNLSTGAKNTIYNSFISFFPHIKISSDDQIIIEKIYKKIYDKNNFILPVKKIRANIDNRKGKNQSNYIYIINDFDSKYVESILPNLCYDIKSPILSKTKQKKILHSLKIDTVVVNKFRKGYLPGIILGQDIAKKLKVLAYEEADKKCTINLEFNNNKQEFVVRGLIKSGNPILANICIIDELYDLINNNVLDKITYEIFIQLKNPLKAEMYYEKQLKQYILPEISEENVEIWTRHSGLKKTLEMAGRISKVFSLISIITWILAGIALFALITLILYYRVKEIAIFLSHGYKHINIFEIFIYLILFLYLIGECVASILIFILNSFSGIIFKNIPYDSNIINLGHNILMSLVIIMISFLISYFIIVIGKKKLIVDIYNGK